MTDIHALEEAALCGLPALRTEDHFGWRLRFSDGYSRRANSVVPFPALGEDPPLEARMDHCEAAYARAGLPCIVKMTRAAPTGLEQLLTARGYGRDADTLVQTRDLDAADTTLPSSGVEIAEAPVDAWLDTWASLSERANQVDTLAALLRAIAVPALYVWIRDRGVGIACARAAIANGVVGLYDLQVDPRHRRRGLGTDLARARLAWAVRLGVRRAFLQVMAGNEDARALQTGLGFGGGYRYWYRVRPAAV